MFKTRPNKERKREEMWSLTEKELFEILKSSAKGLSSKEANERLKVHGFNNLSEKEKKTGIRIFLAQFANPLLLVLVFATVISYFLGEKINALVILIIVGLIAIFGFLQEYKAEKTIRELKKYLTIKCKVLRNSEVAEIKADDLVPGDIVYLNIGDIVPADIRLLKADDLSTDESALTGESVPVTKKVEVISPKLSSPQSLRNIAFMGTSVSSGYGDGVVITTGEKTFFGRTAAYLKLKLPEADFQKNIKKFSNFILKVIIAFTIFIFAANTLLGRGWLNSFLFALALAIGITPEVLPIIITITLSKGAMLMAKKKVITKKLASIEDLGNIDTLCCDKTGTLTEGKVTLKDYINLENKKDLNLALYGLLCNSSNLEKHRRSFGNPIDKALWESHEAAILKEQMKDYSIIDQNEFDFVRRRVSVVVKKGSKKLLIVKGAPDSVLNICKSAIFNGKKNAFLKEAREKAEKLYLGYEKEGLRILAVAEKEEEKNETTKEDEKNLTLLGFLLFWDPPKKTVKAALKLFQKMGVNIKVISGDSILVTKKICEEVGLTIAKDRIISGDDLAKLNPQDFEIYSQEYNVFARVTPEQKYKIVSYLNKEGHIVGFLGDGINDAPALRAADVGISVDSATGIAKEAADIILLQKSLHVLADGIIEGRKIFSNITKYILNTISANYGNMLTVALSSLFMRFIPLLPSQILLNNLLSDTPNITIATDNVDPELLKKPRHWNFKLISRFMVYFGLISSFFDLVLIFALLYILKTEVGLFRTSWFLESVLSEIIILFALRTKFSFYKSRPGWGLIITSIIAAAVSVVIIYINLGNRYFEFVPIAGKIIAVISLILIAYFMTAEIFKKYFFRKFGF